MRPPPGRRLGRVAAAHPLLTDTLVAVGLSAVSVLQGWQETVAGRAWSPAASVLAVLATLPVALRRRAPIGVLVTCLTFFVWYAADGYDPGTITYGLIVSLYTVAATQPWWRVLVATVACGRTAGRRAAPRRDPDGRADARHERRRGHRADPVHGRRPAAAGARLTTFDLDEYVYSALRAGASGVLLKETSPERLLAAIRTVAGGDMLFAPSVTRRLVEAYAPAAAGPPAPDLRHLTNREIEVLRLVGTGQPNPDIAAELYVSEATVKSHLNRLMAKLNLSSRAQAVVIAYECRLITAGRPH